LAIHRISKLTTTTAKTQGTIDVKNGREAANAIRTLANMAAGADRATQASHIGRHFSSWAIIRMVKLVTRMANGIGNMNNSANAERRPRPRYIQLKIRVRTLGRRGFLAPEYGINNRFEKHKRATKARPADTSIHGLGFILSIQIPSLLLIPFTLDTWVARDTQEFGEFGLGGCLSSSNILRPSRRIIRISREPQP
jgi:hypothetical protein